MPSEYTLNMCFIRPAGDAAGFHHEIEQEMTRLFHKGVRWSAERKLQDELDIAVVEVNGLTHLNTEEEVLGSLEDRMDSDCWEWLGGFELHVIPKIDAGACRLKVRRT
ncbi:hypothetical protein DNH61_13735 [Paenibacillus sambharensis]|uniref:Uncharacterized protein n=1 Tax=Paenibacillus sambharensis TaxID=1803190 RepID=A0A2W1L9K0_9BACL|nr:hypothetical protein [Paenibacillus sambharensis]PZD95583.1 hypothetical protein DNH61_13735 [Paenibacillus sambharensis]